jgi:hypothetical protein
MTCTSANLPQSLNIAYIFTFFKYHKKKKKTQTHTHTPILQIFFVGVGNHEPGLSWLETTSKNKKERKKKIQKPKILSLAHQLTNLSFEDTTINNTKRQKLPRSR